MQNKLGLFICTLIIALFISSLVESTPLVNGDLETNNFTGWTLDIPTGGYGQVRTTYVSNSSVPDPTIPTTTYTPVSGTYFAVLKTDGAGSYTRMSQTIAMNSGDMLSGWAAFDYGDRDIWINGVRYVWNDNAHVKIFDSSNNLLATPWEVWGEDVVNYYDGPWTAWTWTAPSAGSYTLTIGVANDADGGFDSFVLFDGGKFTPIPEPGTLILLSISLLGLLGVSCKKNKKNQEIK